MNREKLEHHIKNLTERHHALDKEIQHCYDDHVSDDIVTAMKLRKLHLLDEIAICEKKLEEYA